MHPGSIISDFITVPEWRKSLQNSKLQDCYISTDSGQLFKVSISCMNSSFEVEFRQLNNVFPILMMAYLKRVNGYDVMALFGDLCDGAVVKVGDNTVIPLKKLSNASPVLDSVLVSDKTCSRLIMSCGARNGRLIEYKKGIPAVTIASCHDGFKGVTGIWSMKKSEMDMHHSFLVISYINETRVLRFKGGL